MLKKIAILFLGAAALAAIPVAGASAATWDQTHPRRTEVNHRLAHQDHRINRDLREGKITFWQAMRLHRDDRAIRTSERTDARFDHGHVTRADQRGLNQDENAVNRDIHHDVH